MHARPHLGDERLPFMTTNTAGFPVVHVAAAWGASIRQLMGRMGHASM